MRTLCCMLLLSLISLPAGADEKEPGKKKLSKAQIAKAEKAVKKHLEKVKGGHGQLARIDDKAVAKSIPGYAFFAVLYRQFPVPVQLPQGMKAANLFAVGTDAKPKLLSSGDDLRNFFKDELPELTGEAQFKDAARAYVRLSQELHQDGFYRFKLEDDSTKIKGGETATARVGVAQGGNGTLEATLKFERGKLNKIDESVTLKPGPRPICQATKLLDKDPIVRAMAEQALVCMGQAAKDYLDEQKAKASPELKKAIDRVWRKIVESDQ
jgi:hypothetical protein